MKVTLESTSRIVSANGIDCRVWEGITERGVPCFALIPRIAAHDPSQFAAELREHKPPSDKATECFPLRMVL